MSILEGKTTWRNFRGAYRLSGTGIIECLEIIDVGCNLKQFGGLIWLTLTPIFHDSPCPHTVQLVGWYWCRKWKHARHWSGPLSRACKARAIVLSRNQIEFETFFPYRPALLWLALTRPAVIMDRAGYMHRGGRPAHPRINRPPSAAPVAISSGGVITGQLSK